MRKSCMDHKKKLNFFIIILNKDLKTKNIQ